MSCTYPTLFNGVTPQVQVDDVISLKIYDTYNPKVLDFQLESIVLEITKDYVYLKDVKIIRLPDEEEEDETLWKINIKQIAQADLDSYYYKKLGTTYDFPEYFL